MVYKHGLAGRSPLDPARHPLYSRWVSLRQRCYNPNNHRYSEYGSRGIIVCTRWDDFALFVQDVMCKAHALEPGYSLDRIDVDGIYEPDNIEWSTAAQQRANQRRVPPHLRHLHDAEEAWYAEQQERALIADALEQAHV